MNDVHITTLDDFRGYTFTSVYRDTWDGGEDRIVFVREDGAVFHMIHLQDCCEDVRIEDIAGDLEDLVGHPVGRAYIAESEANEGETGDMIGTWTFYRFSTVKGDVVIRWLGVSHGYYSERVDIVRAA